MRRQAQTLLRGTLGLFLLTAFFGTAAHAQDGPNFAPIGGPYEPDDHTVVLMHFNEDASNSADAFDVPEPQVFGRADDDGPPLRFLNNPIPGFPDLGKNVLLDNNQTQDSSYVAIPDADALDLTGDWTIEVWVNVATFTAAQGSRNFAPRIFSKENFDGSGGPNYYTFFRANGDFQSGFGTGSGIISDTSPTGTGSDATWYHITFIRDAESQLMAQLIHTPDADGNLDLVYYGTTSFSTDAVETNDGPLIIGAFPFLSQGYLDGFLDEFRVSNVVRNFRAPPIVSDVTDLPNQTADSTAPYEVEATVTTLGDVPVQSATLYYDVVGEGVDDSTEFVAVDMQPTGEASRFAAQIPQQDVGTSLRYYIAAQSGGETTTVPQPTGEDDGDIFYQFAVVQPESQTLNLTFEEGDVGDRPQTGDIADESYMNHRVEVVGTPRYTDDAIVGDRALSFAPEDSAYLKIDSSPALASREYLLDFWFKVDSVTTGARYVLKENSSLDEGPIFHINYKVFTFSADQSLRGAFREESGGLNGGDLDPGIVPETNTWYHATLFSSVDDAYFRFTDRDDNVVGEATYSGENLPALETSGPLYIGFSPIEPGSNYFYGKLDDITFYNYPRDAGVTRVTDVTQLSGTQSVDEAPFEVEATISASSELTEASVHYDVTPSGEMPSGGPPFDDSVDLADQGSGRYLARIPDQEPGSVVRYYVAVEDAGSTRLTVPSGVETGGASAYRFGVGREQGQMLNLTFENGSGSDAPSNQGLYDLPIMLDGIEGPPTYSDDAAPGGGSQSLQFAGDDSARVRIDSPFLTSEEFLLDFWFKPDGGSLHANTFLVTKEGGAGLTSIDSPNQINYKVFTCCGLNDNTLRGASLEKFGQLNGPLLDPGAATVEAQWQHAVYYMSKDAAYFAFLTQNDDGSYDVVGEAGYAAVGKNEGELPAQKTLGDFLLGWTTEGVEVAPFNGKMDEVKFYNYAKDPSPNVLDALTVDSVTTVANEDLADRTLPDEYRLEANYPNPFRWHSTIEYALPKASHVTLAVYDLLGRRVRTLVDRQQGTGHHLVLFEAGALPSGVYFYRLKAGDTMKTRKMTVVR